jgi:hypothetical protein
MRDFLFMIDLLAWGIVCSVGSTLIEPEYSKAFGVTTRNKVLKWCAFVFYADQAVPVVTKVVMVESPIAV